MRPLSRDQPSLGTWGAGIAPSQMLGRAGCRSPMTLASRSTSKSARRIRTRRPTWRAGSLPESIHYLDFRVMRNCDFGALLGQRISRLQVRIIRREADSGGA